MRNLYYYFGELIKGDEDKLLNFLSSSSSTLSPIFSHSELTNKVTFLIFADWGGAEKVIWKKFKDPRYHKYLTAFFYKIKIEPPKAELEEEWLIEKEENLDYNSIDLSNKTLKVIEGTTEQELETLIGLVVGNAEVFPFNFIKKEQILIL